MVVTLTKPQPRAQIERITAHEVKPATPSQPQLAMFRQQLQSLQHLNTLAGQIRRATQSHELTVCDRGTDTIRAAVAKTAEDIYRYLAAAPMSALDHVRAEHAALLADLAIALTGKGYS